MHGLQTMVWIKKSSNTQMHRSIHIITYQAFRAVLASMTVVASNHNFKAPRSSTYFAVVVCIFRRFDSASPSLLRSRDRTNRMSLLYICLHLSFFRYNFSFSFFHHLCRIFSCSFLCAFCLSLWAPSTIGASTYALLRSTKELCWLLVKTRKVSKQAAAALTNVKENITKNGETQ